MVPRLYVFKNNKIKHAPAQLQDVGFDSGIAYGRPEAGPKGHCDPLWQWDPETYCSSNSF